MYDPKYSFKKCTQTETKSQNHLTTGLNKIKPLAPTALAMVPYAFAVEPFGISNTNLNFPLRSAPNQRENVAHLQEWSLRPVTTMALLGANTPSKRSNTRLRPQQ